MIEGFNTKLQEIHEKTLIAFPDSVLLSSDKNEPPSDESLHEPPYDEPPHAPDTFDDAPHFASSSSANADIPDFFSTATKRTSEDALLPEDMLSAVPQKKKRPSRALRTATISIGNGEMVVIDKTNVPPWPSGGIHITAPFSKLVRSWDRDSVDWDPPDSYSNLLCVEVNKQKHVIAVKDLPNLYRNKARTSKTGETQDKGKGKEGKDGPGWTPTERNQWNQWKVTIVSSLGVISANLISYFSAPDGLLSQHRQACVRRETW